MRSLNLKEFVIMLIGCLNVGKTTFIESVTNNKFTRPTGNTKKYQFEYSIDSNNQNSVHFEVSEVDYVEHDSLPNWRDIDAVIFMYDITDRKSFESIKKFISNSNRNELEQLVLIMVGNKIDFSERKIANDEAYEFARSYNMELIETSVKTRANIDTVFKNIGFRLLNKSNDYYQGDCNESFLNDYNQGDCNELFPNDYNQGDPNESIPNNSSYTRNYIEAPTENRCTLRFKIIIFSMAMVFLILFLFIYFLAKLFNNSSL